MNLETLKRYGPAGPRKLRCLRCGKLLSSNALARAAHDRWHAKRDIKKGGQ